MFNEYARRVDAIAKAAFAEYRKAEDALQAAEVAANTSPQTAARKAHTRGDYLEARGIYAAARKELAAPAGAIREIRAELAAKIDEINSARPGNLDGAAAAQAEGGALTYCEYLHLMQRAQAADDLATLGLIGKHAAQAAEAKAQKRGRGDRIYARALYYLAAECDRWQTGAKYLQELDALADLYSRCVENPARIRHWDEMAGDIVENF